MKGFNELSKASLAAGASSEKTKELIALALGVAAHCDGCLGFHAKALVRLGASQAEVEEALAVAVYMGGGRR
jgi:AhpD family alkylhydroperoxidase